MLTATGSADCDASRLSVAARNSNRALSVARTAQRPDKSRCVGSRAAGVTGRPLRITEVRAFVHSGGSLVAQYDDHSPEFVSALNADNYGTLSFSYTNKTAVTQTNVKILAFVDLDVDAATNGYANEYGALVSLGTPPGSIAGAIAASSWEIDEPGFLFGNIFQHLNSGSLDNANSVGIGSIDDVSFALGFVIPEVKANQRATVFVRLNSSDIGGLVQVDPDSNMRIWVNGYAAMDAPPPMPETTPAPSSAILVLGSLAVTLAWQWRKRRATRAATLLLLVLGLAATSRAQQTVAYERQSAESPSLDLSLRQQPATTPSRAIDGAGWIVLSGLMLMAAIGPFQRRARILNHQRLIHLSAGFLLLTLSSTATLHAQPNVSYTTEADFRRGTLLNLVPSGSGDLRAAGLQIAPSEQAKPLPYLNVATSNRGTIVRIHTETGQIVGEFQTAPDGRPRNPSRTTVDFFGNVWSGNRDETVTKGSVVKVGLIVGGTRVTSGGAPDANGQYLKGPFTYNTCVDKNRDGLIKTSHGLGDILPWPNTAQADDNGGVSTAEDECILLYQRTSGRWVRHISVDTNNDVWVGGMPNTQPDKFDKLDGTTGAILETVDTAAIGCGGYGGAVDQNGVLWSSSFSPKILRYDTRTHQGACIDVGNFQNSYGLAIDRKGDVWVSDYYPGAIGKLSPAGVPHWGSTADTRRLIGGNPKGIAITPADSNAWVALTEQRSVVRLDSEGRIRETIPVGYQPMGVSVDPAGCVWVTNYGDSTAMRIRPDGGTNSLGAVDKTIALNVSGLPEAKPYNYSDMTGSALLTSSIRVGIWNVMHDSGMAGNVWNMIRWNTELQSVQPAGSVLIVEARASDTATQGGNYTVVQNGVGFALVGRYIEVRVTFRVNDKLQSPLLADLSITSGTIVDDLLARAKDGGVLLSWTPIPQAAGYNLYRRTGAAGPWTRVASALPAASAIYLDSQVSANSVYYYDLRWFDRAAAESESSIEPSGTPSPQTSRSDVAPTILSAPARRAVIGESYAYQLRTSDPNPGDRLSFTLQEAPQGMTIGSSGLIQWQPTSGQSGLSFVKVNTTDTKGRFATQRYSVAVASVFTNYSPVFTSTPGTAAIAGYQYAYLATASDPNPEDLLTYELVIGPAGMRIQADSGWLVWPAPVLGQQSVTIRVRDAHGASDQQSFTLTVAANAPPVITSTPVLTALVGVKYQYRITARDPEGGVIRFQLANLPAGMTLIPTTGAIEWTPTSAQSGTQSVTAEAVDPGGLTASQSYTITVSTPPTLPGQLPDSTAPVVSILTPAPGATLAEDVTVTGTASDAQLQSWTLDYQVPGAANWTTLSSGSASVTAGSLGKFPASLLANNPYRLRLSARDANSIVSQEIEVQVESGQMKLGAFTLSYVDLKVPAPGVPITLIRNYDSTRTQLGDFGPGWNLAISSVDVRVSSNQDVYITLPNGRRAAFAFRPVSISPWFAFIMNNRYVAPAGVYDSLENTDCPQVVFGGSMYLCGMSRPYEPQNFILNTKEGLKYFLTAAGGIQRIEDRNGRAVDITSAAIRSSSGRNVTIARDPSGRIVSITDASGKSLLYAYDSAGRLRDATDQAGLKTTFVYEGATSYIKEVQSPRQLHTVETGVRLQRAIDSAYRWQWCPQCIRLRRFRTSTDEH